jgi:hypothetical protein
MDVLLNELGDTPRVAAGIYNQHFKMNFESKKLRRLQDNIILQITLLIKLE